MGEAPKRSRISATAKQASGRSGRPSGLPAADAVSITNATPRPAVATGPDNRIRHLNAAAAELLGVDASQAIGANLQEILDARDVFGNRLCSDHCAFHEMVLRNEPPEWFELDVRTAQHGRRRVTVSIVVVRGQDPGHYELVYVLTPVRRRRRADEAIDRLLAQTNGYRPGLPAGSGDGTERPAARLTSRQRQVLERLVAGHHARAIAEELGISILTVRSHVRKILEAFGASSQLEAVAIAMREHLT